MRWIVACLALGALALGLLVALRADVGATEPVGGPATRTEAEPRAGLDGLDPAPLDPATEPGSRGPEPAPPEATGMRASVATRTIRVAHLVDERGRDLDDLEVTVLDERGVPVGPPGRTGPDGRVELPVGDRTGRVQVLAGEGGDGPQRALAPTGPTHRRFGRTGQRLDATFDGRRLLGEVDLALLDGDELRLVVRSGPRIPLALRNDPGGPLVATLHPVPSTERDPEPSARPRFGGWVPDRHAQDGHLAWERAGTGWRLVRAQALPWLRTPVHRTDAPFARFDRLPPEATGQGAWRLRVESADGAWVGEALLDHVEHFPAPVAVELTATARLHVEVLDERGRPVPDAELRLVRLDDADHPLDLRPPDRLPPPVADLRAPTPDGWRAAGLPAGPVGVEARRLGSRRARARVDLRPGDEARVTLTLLPLGGTGRISGRVRAGCDPRSGAVGVRLTPVELDDPNADGLTRVVPVTWREVDGRWEGEWAAEDLAEGSYRVEPTTPALFSWTPLSTVARPGDEDVPFELCARDSERGLHLLVLDDRTGEPVPSYRVELTGTVGLRQLAFGRDCTQETGRDDPYQAIDWSRPLVTGVPEDGELELRVISPAGTTRATLADFDEVVVTEDGTRWSVATLRVGR